MRNLPALLRVRLRSLLRDPLHHRLFQRVRRHRGEDVVERGDRGWGVFEARLRSPPPILSEAHGTPEYSGTVADRLRERTVLSEGESAYKPEILGKNLIPSTMCPAVLERLDPYLLGRQFFPQERPPQAPGSRISSARPLGTRKKANPRRSKVKILKTEIRSASIRSVASA